MKKIIIIGGGISGLTSGIYALKSGFEVEIYEKNNIVGGECTGWDRKGYHIDNCIHWMMGTTKGTHLNKIWNETGAIDENTEIISFEKMYTSELNGERVSLWKDPERTRKELIALSPNDEVEINNLIEYVKIAKTIEIPAEKPPEMMNLLDGIKMSMGMKNALKLIKEFSGEDTTDLMNRFKHPLIKCMISDFCTKESMGSSFPMAYGNFTSGDGGIPRGGSRAMALRMKRKFEELGGKIYTNSEVKKIQLDGKIATGIILENVEIKQADYFISACDPDYTFNHLLSPSYMDAVFKDVYSNRKAYPIYGMFQVAFAVNTTLDILDGEIMMDSGEIKTESWINDRITIKIYSYEPDFAPEGKQIIQVLLGLTEDAYDYWSELYKNKEAYNAKKEEIASNILKKLEERFPEYQNKLEILDTWTPVTYKRYCNAYKGYNQAYVITKLSRKKPYPSPYIKDINNVIMSGQWISPPGGLPGAAIQGKYATQRILKLISKLVNKKIRE